MPWTSLMEIMQVSSPLSLPKVRRYESVWGTDLRDEERAWLSETAKSYFGIRNTDTADHYEIMRGLIHPEDWWEYEEGIPPRTQGKNLDRELSVRMKGVSGEYHMFSIHTKIVTDEKNAERYLVILCCGRRCRKRRNCLQSCRSLC